VSVLAELQSEAAVHFGSKYDQEYPNRSEGEDGSCATVRYPLR
jgi:hypothetical protein